MEVVQQAEVGVGAEVAMHKHHREACCGEVTALHAGHRDPSSLLGLEVVALHHHDHLTGEGGSYEELQRGGGSREVSGGEWGWRIARRSRGEEGGAVGKEPCICRQVCDLDPPAGAAREHPREGGSGAPW